MYDDMLHLQVTGSQQDSSQEIFVMFSTPMTPSHPFPLSVSLTELNSREFLISIY